MRWAPFAILGTLVITAPARAAEDAVDDVAPPTPAIDDLVLDTGRRPVPAPEADTYRFVLSGEHQIRFQAERSFPLVATPSAQLTKPGLLEQSLGQNAFVTHWLRLTPRLQLREALVLVAQLDLTGLVVGDKAIGTSADNTPRNDYNAFGNVQPRWLYAEYRLPWGMIRIGQQPNHWGMGVLVNDGDHPSLFGDYRYGTIVERLLFAFKPGGADSDFHVAMAADLVFRDPLARLTEGQQALQGVLAAFWAREPNTVGHRGTSGGTKVGIYTQFRHQRSDRDTAAPGITYTDDLDQVTVDLHGRIVERVPGDAHAFLYAEAEAAYTIGATDLGRQARQARTQIRAYGGAAKIGAVHAKRIETAPLGDASKVGQSYGDLVGEMEIGYASGDADPYDGASKRFTFDPNHKVGLLLFDEILRFQTARSATAAGERATLGADPSNGGVFGAEYINPTVTYRPRSWLDLKGGMVIAQATSEVVDPYRVATSGSYVNYRGQSPKSKDLGLELDGGAQTRFPLDYGLVGEVGAQAGVLFPGEALAMPTQWIAIGRLGLQF